MLTYTEASTYLKGRGYAEIRNCYGNDFVKGDFKIKLIGMTHVHAHFTDEAAGKMTTRLCSSEDDLARFADDVENNDMQKYFEFDDFEYDDFDIPDKESGTDDETSGK